MNRFVVVGVAIAELIASALSASAFETSPMDTDEDGDGLSAADEFRFGTDPSNPDSDGGGAADGWEVYFKLDPTDRADDAYDTDADGLDNYREYLLGTSPVDPDTDDDGLIDSIDPDPLTHYDGYYDCVRAGCNPGTGPGPNWTERDPWQYDSEPCPGGQGACPGHYWSDPGHGSSNNTSNEGFCGGGQGGCPLGPEEPPDADTDLDGLPDTFEELVGTDRLDPDVDRDGLSDGSELNYPGLDPISRDTDRDGLLDGEETGPLTPADLPGILDRGPPSPSTFARAGLDASRTTGTDPKRWDSDGDGIADAFDDEDGDGLANVFEVRLWVEIGGDRFTNAYWGLSDPRDPDTDCDGLLDGDEVDPARAPTGVASDPTRLDTDGDDLSDRVDPNPQVFTVLPPLVFGEVRMGGVLLDGNASVSVGKQATAIVDARMFYTEPTGDLLPIPASRPVDVYLYFVQRRGDTWVAKLTGPAIQTGEGGFVASVRLTSDDVRAGDSYLFLRTAARGGEPLQAWVARAQWTEPGAPSFAIPPLPTEGFCGGN